MISEIYLAPSWVIVQTKSMSEEITERALRQAGYRSYFPRYRRLLSPHGRTRRGVTMMRPLFPRLVFAQDWRGWPDRSISGATGLMPARPGVARLSDADVALIMERERCGEFDDVHHPRGSETKIRDDLIVGDEVDWEAFGRRVIGVLEALSANGKAVVQAMLFDRVVRTEVAASSLRKVYGVSG
jgi:hypothetical protein